MSINPDKISEIIRDVASDKIVPRFRQLGDGDVRSKSGPTDLVTIADEEAEIELTRILKDVLPGSYAVGEEAVASGKVTRDILKTSDDYIWVIDPVDGTHNFAHGVEKFGTMVALVKGGETIASWIYQIPRERMVWGGRGEGVYANGDSVPVPAATDDDVDFKTVSAFISRKLMPLSIRPYVEEKILLLDNAETHFCSAWEYVDLVDGLRSFCIYTRIEPWDHLAGALMLKEQGRLVRKWDGSDYTARDLRGGIVSASSEVLWDRIYKTFLEEAMQRVPNLY